jgi:hypothetical protein
MNEDGYIAEQARRRMAQSQAVASPASHATGVEVTSAYIGQVARRRMMHSKETASPFRQLNFDVSSQDSMFQVVRGLLPIVRVFWLTDCATLTPRLRESQVQREVGFQDAPGNTEESIGTSMTNMLKVMTTCHVCVACAACAISGSHAGLSMQAGCS